jgi:hypothetical protein
LLIFSVYHGELKSLTHVLDTFTEIILFAIHLCTISASLKKLKIFDCKTDLICELAVVGRRRM